MKVRMRRPSPSTSSGARPFAGRIADMAHAPWCPAWSHAICPTRVASKRGSRPRRHCGSAATLAPRARSSGPDGGGVETPFPTLGRVLNFVGSTFGGQNPPERLAASESLGERALGLAWDVFSRLSPSRGARDNSRLDPVILARAAGRASAEERDTARQTWSSRSKRDAETGALLCLGCVLRVYAALLAPWLTSLPSTPPQYHRAAPRGGPCC